MNRILGNSTEKDSGDLDELADALFRFWDQIESGQLTGIAAEEAAREVALEVYRGFSDKIRPLLKGLAAVLPELESNTSFVTAAILKSIAKVKSNADLMKQASALNIIEAKVLKARMDAYRKAGFTRNEAFELVRQHPSGAASKAFASGLAEAMKKAGKPQS